MTDAGQRDVGAFVEAVALGFGREPGARRVDHGPVTAIHHASPIEHPWPRRFWFRDEFMNAGAPPETLAEVVRGHLGGRAAEHVVLDFHRDPEARRRRFADLGYLQAWVTGLLARDLGDERIVAAPPPVVVRPATSAGDLRAIEALHGLVEGTLGPAARPALHDFLLEVDGTPVAHAQLVTAAPQIGYVSEMLTAEGHRRRGHCRRLLVRLEAEAHRLGCRRMILMPSLMAARLGLYERQGYRRAVPVAVLVPSAPPR